MRFSKKTAHRIIIALAMVFPIAYMLGTQLAVLAGAHGEKLLETGATTNIAPSYDELMTPEKFSYDAFDWTNVNGQRYGFSLGLFELTDNWDLYLHFQAGTHGVRAWYEGGQGDEYVPNSGLGWYGAPLDDDYFLYNLNPYRYEGYTDEVILDVEKFAYFCCYFVADESDVSALVVEYGDLTWTEQYYYWDSSTSSWTYVNDLYIQGVVLSIFFDDGQNLPAGVSWNDELASYFVPTVKPVEVETYSASLFGSMFPRGNFIEKVGESAISETPKGFSPFGQMLRYIDLNMLHAGDTQIGLMFYGMVYWLLHVVLADLVYHVLVFIPNLICSIFTWFGRGLDDDKGE